MTQYQCLIIDDDEIDRLTVLAYTKKYECLNVVGVFADAAQALQKGIPANTDVLFLDIDMPGINGLEFRKIMNQVPVCIFITAHPEHAAESFNLETLDFIVKPLKPDRFLQTVARIEQYFEVRNKAALFEKSFGTDTILIKEGHKETRSRDQTHEADLLRCLLCAQRLEVRPSRQASDRLGGHRVVARHCQGRT